MDSPFIYSKYVTGRNFISRSTNCSALENLLRQGENVGIWEPYGAGKKSIVYKVLTDLRVKAFPFSSGKVSAMNLRDSETFLRILGDAVIRMLASTPDEYSAVVERYLGGTHFVFDRQIFSDKDIILSTNWTLDENDMRALFEMPYRLAADKQAKIFLIVDEFQNIDFFEDGETIFKVMEGVMDKMKAAQIKNFSYIFLGSQVNAMSDIFIKRHFFYRRVERLRLIPMDELEIVDHINKGFLASGKVIERELIASTCRLFKCNMFYINHFISICDSLSKGYIMEPVLLQAFDSLIAIHQGRFIATMNDLTNFQVGLLHAVIDGYKKFSTAEVIAKYSLNSSANVRRLKDALMKKEIVIFEGSEEEPMVIDPLFEYWLRRYFFKSYLR